MVSLSLRQGTVSAKDMGKVRRALQADFQGGHQKQRSFFWGVPIRNGICNVSSFLLQAPLDNY